MGASMSVSMTASVSTPMIITMVITMVIFVYDYDTNETGLPVGIGEHKASMNAIIFCLWFLYFC